MTKLRVDLSLLTGRDYIAIEEATGKPMAETLTTAAGMFAALWRMKLRDDPTFTYEQALDMSFADFEIVGGDAEGETRAAGNGEAPSASLVSGG
jgi:hypothetical protein